jgi:hypothetical protein
MSFKKITIALLAITVLAFASMPLVAQTIVTGDLIGTVTDQSGAVVSGANITLKNGETGTTQDTTTNTSGSYRISLLKPGDYTVTAKSANMNEVSRKVIIAVGQTTTASIQLGVKAGGEMIEVTAEPPLLQSENANISTTFTSKQIDLLPNPGNDLTYVAQTAPGVLINTSDGGGYGNFTAFGLPATANLFTVNGNDEMDPFLNLNNSGATNLLLGANELQEATVVANGYTGQYGRQAGAQVNYATKSGSNNWHGNAQYWWTGRALTANDWFNNHTGTARPFANNNQWAGSIGGPIKKDKLFFFFDNEGLRYILPTSNQVFVPTPAFEAAVINALKGSQGLPNSVPFYNSMFNLYNGAQGIGSAVPVSAATAPSDPFGCGDVNLDDGTGAPAAGFLIPELAGFGNPATNVAGVAGGKPCLNTFRSTVGALSKEWLISTRVDYNIGEKDKFYGRYRGDHGLQPTNIDPINPLFNAISNQPQHEGQLTETHTFTTNLVNQTILSGSWYSAIFTNANTAASRAAYPGNMFSFDFPLSTLGGADQSFPQGRNVTQYQLVDDISWSKGNHTFKFGGNYRRNDVTDHSYGTVTAPRLRIFSTSDFASGFIDQIRERFPIADREPIALYSVGAYLQDEWRLSNNLKFTMALRVDRNSNAVCQHDCVSLLSQNFSDLAHNVSTPYNVVVQNGLHQVFPDVEKIVVQPRFGFAWTPLGSKSTVIRGGIGLFSDLYPATLVDRFTRNAPQDTQFTLVPSGPFSPAEPGNAFAQVVGCNTGFFNTFKTGGNVAAFNTAAPGCAVPDYNSAPNMLRNPKYAEWNFEIQQGIGSKTSIDINYVGNHGYDLFIVNPGVNSRSAVGFAGLPTTTPDGHFRNVTDLRNTGISNYHGLTTSVTRKFTYGFQGSFNYTWSHALDDESNGGVLPYSLVDSFQVQLDPNNLRRLNYSNADYDVRHNISANYVWELPYKSSSRGWNYLVGGWVISGTFFSRSGLPFSVFNSSVAAGAVGGVANFASGTGLAVFVPGSKITSCDSPSTPCMTTANFLTDKQQTAASSLGNLPRNSFRGPGYFNTDMSVNKNFAINERVTFRVGANAFNLLNHANFANPGAGGDIHSGVLGLIQNTVVPPTSPYGAFVGSAVSGRMLQLTGKIIF